MNHASLGVSGAFMSQRQWPFVAGTVAEQIRRSDWSCMSLGTVEDWPADLRTALDMMLGCQFPATLHWGPDLHFFYNDSYLPLLPGDQADWFGRSVLEVAPATAKEFRALADRVLRGEHVTVANQRLRSGAGDAFKEAWFDLHYSPVHDGYGKVAGIFGIGLETTQRMLAERAKARAIEQRFRALVESSSDVIYSMSPDWTELREVHGRNFLKDSTVPGKLWLEKYVPREDRDLVWASIQEAIKAERPFELEHRIFRDDGSVEWIFSRAVPLRNAQNDITEWFGMANDVTGRKQTESVLMRNDGTWPLGHAPHRRQALWLDPNEEPECATEDGYRSFINVSALKVHFSGLREQARSEEKCCEPGGLQL